MRELTFHFWIFNLLNDGVDNSTGMYDVRDTVPEKRGCRIPLVP